MNNANAILTKAFQGSAVRDVDHAKLVVAKVNVPEVTPIQFETLACLKDKYNFSIRRSGKGVVVIAKKI